MLDLYKDMKPQNDYKDRAVSGVVLEAHVSYCSVHWSPPARLSVIHCPIASRLGHRNGGGRGPQDRPV